MKHLAAALLLSFVALTAAAQTGSPAPLLEGRSISPTKPR